MNIFSEIVKGLETKKEFVSYRKPNDNKLHFLAPHKIEVANNLNLKEKGFVFSPFDDRGSSVLFLSENATILSEEIVDFTSRLKQINFPISSDKKEHLGLVEKGIEAINNTNLRKVVLSRVEEIDIKSIDVLQTFQNLLSLYENALVYVWFHPKIGLWLGATPETLVSLKNHQFSTIALAGTQSYHNTLNVVWGTKEKEEHQIVVNFITNQLEKLKLKDISVSETKTVRAGQLLHLRTDIKGTLQEYNIKNLITLLHPTPAVCGLPKEQAKEFILENEYYSRGFYSGFLGEVNIDNNTNLFVNLRCMQVKENTVCIYVGGGITKDSDAIKEWAETQQKTQTIKKAIYF